MYQYIKDNPPEICGCGTAALVAYTGHNTSYMELQYIHEKEFYDVLLATLEKRKKVNFADDSDKQKDPYWILQWKMKIKKMAKKTPMQ